MASDVEIDRALATVTATLNDQKIEHLDHDRVVEILTGSTGGEPLFTLDAGGGIHDESGVRVAVLRRGTGGRWITERQNHTAAHAKTAVPAAE